LFGHGLLYVAAMSVAVSCNLSDGVVLAVDSAVALRTAGQIVKIYENAEKLFPLGDRPIGMAVYGLAAIGDRSIGSYLREFATENPVVADPNSTLQEVVEAAREFLMAAYLREVAPDLERSLGRPWDQIPVEDRPPLGVVMGGFSPGAHLSEVWRIVLPAHETPGSALLDRARGDFGADTYAMAAPIRRYLRGADRPLVGEILRFMERRSTPLTPAEEDEILRILDAHAYKIRHDAMPMKEGVAYARFLVELVVNHHRFAVGDPAVGGKIQIGRVDYRGGAFQVVHSPRRYNQC
jgi:hypothetical protein